MHRFITDLCNELTCEVRYKPIHLAMYSVDASIYEITPIAAVIPKTKADIQTAIAIAQRYNIPIIPRGAATGIAGGCIGPGLIIDTSVYLNRIVSIDPDQECVTVEPGVIQDQLNNALSKIGYRLGPDTSTGNRATLGGMIANNSAGARSLRFGKMVDHVLELELLLYDRTCLHLKPLTEEEWAQKLTLPGQEGFIYRTIEQIQKTYAQEIKSSFPKLTRRVSGYNLDELIKPNFNNLCKIICGSEGTLGYITEAKVRICKKPLYTGVVVIFAEDMLQYLKHMPYITSFNPLSVEMIDKTIIEMGSVSPGMRGKLDWLTSTPDALFVVEFDGNTPQEIQHKLNRFSEWSKKASSNGSTVQITDARIIEDIFSLRKSGLGLLLSRKSYSRAIAFIEDLTVPNTELSQFITKLQSYLQSIGKQAGIYGHVGEGCIHIRPYIDLRDPNELKVMKTIMDKACELVKEHGGALSGEHGDGIVRAWTTEQMFGKKLTTAFHELKAAFDPVYKMNPGKILPNQEFLDHLRLSPQTPTIPFDTFYDFSQEGGFDLAIDMCNGNGQCRKLDGLMCPSFQATKDEKDSTRARAQALREIIHGKIDKKALDDEIWEVLDLCLQCKGCKTECPSQVDMAKLKSELLYQHYSKKGYPLSSYIFGYIGQLSRFASLFAGLSNYILSTRLAVYCLELIGISSSKPLPKFALKRFSKQFKGHTAARLENHSKQIVLFIDTFTEFNAPEIGIAAVSVLEYLGYQVICPAWQCCGRTLISKGLLPKAKKIACSIINTFYPFVEKNIPIIGLEPSCILTLADEYKDFRLGERALKLSQHVMTFDEFLLLHKEQLALTLPPLHNDILIHGHCHQKALRAPLATTVLLDFLYGTKSQEIPSGCCGMAGSFGHESEHVELSSRIGELKLFPAVRNAKNSTVIIANGVSCRSQIEYGTGTRPLHIAEFIASQLKP